MLRLRVFTLPGSAPRAEASPATLELSALGDFEPGNESAEVLPTDRAGATLRFPAETQAVEARVSTQGLFGYGERRGDAGVDVLLWSERDSVVLSSGAYPGRGGGQALGYSERVGALLVAGGNNPLDTESLVGTLRFSAGTGRIEQSGVASGGLAQPRAFATVTAFGDGFLVAGGQQPVEGVPEAELELHATAELVGPEGGTIQLQNTRTHHAALSLADGRTLLIGGRTKVGSVSIAQYQLELVDPATRRSFVGDAIAPRIDPTALRLTDGRAFVGGGVRLDGSLTEPVGEWLDENGRREPTTLSAEVAPRFERAFIATAGGGLLAVGGCEDRPPASEEDAAACGACRSGCPPLDGYDAWWVDAEGAAHPVSLRGIAAPQPRLLPGSGGSPWLVAADETNPDVPRLFRFNPWASRFERSVVPESRLPRPGLPALALGPDTFAWIDEDARGAELVGLRLGVRSRFARDVALVLASEPLDPLWPVHLVPTRAPGEGARYDGALTLADPTVAVLVADTEYADVTIRLRVSSAALPRVLLGESELGGDACPWPDGDERGTEAEQPTVVRRGTLAELRFHGGRTTACPVAPGRLPIALAAGPRSAVVRELQLTRDGARR